MTTIATVTAMITGPRTATDKWRRGG